MRKFASLCDSIESFHALDRKRYRLFHNLILPTPDGSTQVDHVVVSAHGVFVIETKNFEGWIFGSERDRMWTQKFGRRSYSFQNPLRQNYKHVRALAELTGVGDDALFSLVAFVGGCVRFPNCSYRIHLPASASAASAASPA